MELRAGGMSYEQIAQQVGYANKGTAHKVIAKALERREVEDVDFLRAVEVGRLNALQAALWDRAMSGNLAACRSILHILDLRSRLLGLYEGSVGKDPKDRWDNCQGPPTVVTNPNDCRWTGCDKHGVFPGVPRSHSS